MAERFQGMQERKREFGGGRNRYGNRDNDGGGRFFGLGSINPRGGQNGRDREKPPVMNSGRSRHFYLLNHIWFSFRVVIFFLGLFVLFIL
jgi:hypothetical protein